MTKSPSVNSEIFYLYRFIVPTRYYQIDCIELIMNSTTESLYTESAAGVRNHCADARGEATIRERKNETNINKSLYFTHDSGDGVQFGFGNARNRPSGAGGYDKSLG